MIDTWLSLSLPVMFVAVAGVFSASAALLYWLCFGGLTRRWMLSFSGAVAELFSAIMVIFGIQIGFVANDVWDRNRRASAAVESESASLAMLNALALASGLPTGGIRRAIRVYVSAVTGNEWPSMADNGRGARRPRRRWERCFGQSQKQSTIRTIPTRNSIASCSIWRSRFKARAPTASR